MAIDPRDPAFIRNPYPEFAYHRREQPIVHVPQLAGWMVFRYDDVRDVFVDHGLYSSERGYGKVAQKERNRPAGSEFALDTMVTSDPPRHTRLRGLVAREFTPRAIAHWEPRLRVMVGELMERAEPGSTFDIVKDLAERFPTWVIAEVLGVPPEDYESFRHWSDDELAPIHVQRTEEEQARIAQSRKDLRSYLGDAIARARKDGRDDRPDLIHKLVNARDLDDRLTETELLAFLVLLLVAGNETTMNLIGNGAHQFALHPDAYRRLRADRSLMPTAIEEVLRYDPPVQNLQKLVTRPTEIAGKLLEPGETVLPCVASANRDEKYFPQPDEFLIDRKENEHISFGLGVHFCLGAYLARMEAALAFEALLDRFPVIEPAMPAAEIPFRSGFTVRGISSLPVEVPALATV
jgi:cytochrome P450